MNTNPRPPFDLKAVQTATAFTSPPHALLPTLGAIWDKTVDLLKLAEEKRTAQLKKFWGEKPPREAGFSVLERATLAHGKGPLSCMSEDILESAYFHALKHIHQIKEAFYDLHPLTAPLEGESPDQALMKRLLSRNNLKEEAFLNRVVPPFFALQVEAAFLWTYLEVPKGVPLSPTTRQMRASRGGQGANRGKEELQEALIQCLESASKGEKHSSVSALFDAYFADIEVALEEHKIELKQRAEKGEDIPPYALKLTAEGVGLKLTQWAKENPQFRERLTKLCTLRKLKD